MSGVNKESIYAISRIRATFKDDIGNTPRIVTGTGFWLDLNMEGKLGFITNRHNVDPSLRYPKNNYELVSLSIEFRKKDDQGQYLPNTIFLELAEPTTILSHDSADCALLTSIVVKNVPEDEMKSYKPTPFHISSIANESFLLEKTQIMDLASFVGFPGKTQEWWDQHSNLPIARLASIASNTATKFINSAIPTSDVTLVSGMSFSGSSGSPVFLHQKGFDVKPPLHSNYIESKIIGIMSGHLNEKDPDEEMLKHTGLSYFTRSTSILELVQQLV